MDYLIIDNGKIIGVKYHHHHGGYNDGNSAYYSYDAELRFDTNKMMWKKETTLYQQMAKNGNFEKQEEHGLDDGVEIPDDVQDKLMEILKPLIETAEKYPHRDTFKFFSDRHKHLIKGRYIKALKLLLDKARESNYNGSWCMQHIIVLTKYNKIIVMHMEAPYPKIWNCKVWKINTEVE